MQWAKTENEIVVSCTVQELREMEQQALAVYGVPSHNGIITQIYVANHPSWTEDTILLTVQDFADAQGVDDFGLGWTAEEQEHDANDIVSVSIGRR